MKFSESWLLEWVNPMLNSEQLGEQITMAGLEVEEITPVAADFNHVLVGLVVDCQPHPDADKLRVTKIDVGAEKLLDIVCGAANCRLGIKVAIAMIGAVLPGDFKIKAAKLRGQPSEGMLCSWRELGIAIDSDGIIELPQEAEVGQSLREYLKLDDNSIEISVTPNRADCLSIQGIARDVAVMTASPWQQLTIPAIAAQHAEHLPIQVQSPDACPRYLGRMLTDVDATVATPLWMQEKLRRSGIRSVDVVVDVTNFVMLELGQPMHAFDADTLQQGLIIRQAKSGESLTLLDGNSINLTEDVLIIADDEKPLALAGIFGGQNSGVSRTTRRVQLEAAFFAPAAIAGRARRYGLHTDSSHRFERGVDSTLPKVAIERATQLLMALCGAKPGPIQDVTQPSSLPVPASIHLRREKLDNLIGHAIESDTVKAILQGIGCDVSQMDGEWRAVTPAWRFDLTIEEDLIEEIARVYGYNRIPNMPVRANLTMPKHREAELPLNQVRHLLACRGFQEAITYSFVDPELQQRLHPERAGLVLNSPISNEMSVMRLSLWSGLLAAVRYNQNRQQNRVRLFESGLRFSPDESAPLGVRQEQMLAAVISGARYEEHWDREKSSVDFYDLKGDLEAILDLTGQLMHIEFRKTKHHALHPGQSAEIWLDNILIGYIGVLHPQLESDLDLHGRTVIFEVTWSKIAERKLPQAHAISRFPANRRDIAVVVANDLPAQDIINECWKVGGNQLVGVNLFDVYCGKGVAEGCKSLAISLTLQDTSRTLEEEEIAATVNRCVMALQERYQATLRD